MIVDANDVVISHGRTQRLFTGKAREAAQLLAIRCGHRGCDVPAEFCDVDHVDEWAADGGATDQANAMSLCGSHDRWKHRQRLRGRRDRHGRIHLIRPDGTVIKPVGARDPEWAEPDRSEPDLAEPDAAEPDGTEPDLVKHGQVDPDGVEPDCLHLGTAEPDVGSPLGSPPVPRWREVTWAELAAGSARLRECPDPGWAIRSLDLRPV